jgi:hypothetical protein
MFIPAEAGILTPPLCDEKFLLDSRLRGNDE